MVAGDDEMIGTFLVVFLRLCGNFSVFFAKKVRTEKCLLITSLNIPSSQFFRAAGGKDRYGNLCNQRRWEILISRCIRIYWPNTAPTTSLARHTKSEQGFTNNY